MKKHLLSSKSKIALAVLVALALGILLGALSSNGSSPFSSALSVVFTPLTKVSSIISNKLTDIGASFRSSGEYIRRIEELESMADDYRGQLVDYERTKRKLDTYAEFLEIKEEHPDYTFESAVIVSRDSSDIYGSFVIDKGSADGIEVDMPVIFGKNLIGVIHRVDIASSVVYTVFNPTVNVGAYDISTAEEGYVSTDASYAAQKLLKLSLLPKDTLVAPGGIICTSGAGGVFPKDLIIGTVSKVAAEATKVSSYALVRSAADFDALTDVFVITAFEGQGVY
ncbi:MAG: rod shape-determining protein MreC [Clostridia bacterium]|nr:rod shape-determining protein MreC [Clostridia bacterium]